MKIKHNVPIELELGKTYELKLEEVSGEIRIPPDGTLLRRKAGYKVWWMQNGLRRHIATLEIFNLMAPDLGFTWTDILIIEPGWDYDPTMLQDIPEGKVITEWPEKEEPEPEEDVIKMIFAYLPMQSQNMRLKQAKELGFNAMQAYPKGSFWDDHLDKAANLGMRCLVTLPDNANEAQIKDRISRWGKHQALWGWLSFDDADYRCALGHWTPDDMRRVYDDIKKYDEVHPVVCTVCHGANREDDSWIKYLAIEAFDVFGYEGYTFREQIPDPWEWLEYMYNRLDQYPLLQKKRIIPILPTFERGIFEDPTGKLVRMYEYCKERLGGLKSVACYDWMDVAKYSKYHPEIKQINQDL